MIADNSRAGRFREDKSYGDSSANSIPIDEHFWSF